MVSNKHTAWGSMLTSHTRHGFTLGTHQRSFYALGSPGPEQLDQQEHGKH